MTDSIEIVEEADGVQMDLLAEALGKGKVAEPGAAAEYTEVGAVAADTAEVSQSCSTFPSSASVLMPSARKGLTGPQLESVLQSKFDKDGKFDKEGRRCAAAQSHTLRSPFTNHSH